MENVSVLAAGFSLDELRVEELEPRLEFTTYACYSSPVEVIDGECSACFVDGRFGWFC